MKHEGNRCSKSMTTGTYNPTTWSSFWPWLQTAARTRGLKVKEATLWLKGQNFNMRTVRMKSRQKTQQWQRGQKDPLNQKRVTRLNQRLMVRKRFSDFQIFRFVFWWCFTLWKPFLLSGSADSCRRRTEAAERLNETDLSFQPHSFTFTAQLSSLLSLSRNTHTHTHTHTNTQLR